MKKFLSVLILLTALLVGGCGGKSSMEIDNTAKPNTVTITAENAENGGGVGYLKINDGEAIQVDAKITSGKLLLKIREKKLVFEDKPDKSSVDKSDVIKFQNAFVNLTPHVIDKSGKSFIDVPPDEYVILIDSEDGLTGEIILSAAPKK